MCVWQKPLPVLILDQTQAGVRAHVFKLQIIDKSAKYDKTRQDKRGRTLWQQ